MYFEAVPTERRWSFEIGKDFRSPPPSFSQNPTFAPQYLFPVFLHHHPSQVSACCFLTQDPPHSFGPPFVPTTPCIGPTELSATDPPARAALRENPHKSPLFSFSSAFLSLFPLLLHPPIPFARPVAPADKLIRVVSSRLP